jgi:hypothetical protein
MPKKRVVASFVGNRSPVYKRSAIFVRSTRHLRGCMGDELNNRAVIVRLAGLFDRNRNVHRPS